MNNLQTLIKYIAIFCIWIAISQGTPTLQPSPEPSPQPESTTCTAPVFENDTIINGTYIDGFLLNCTWSSCIKTVNFTENNETKILNGTYINGKLSSCKTTTTKAKYPPLFSKNLAATTILILLLTWICSSAGIGGAALDSVVFITIDSLLPKQVSPLTKAIVFGESLGGFLINCRRRHPLTKRPLINYEVALAFEPLSLLGTQIGVYINQSVPSYLILAGLIIILAFAAYRTINKGIIVWKAERTRNLDDEKLHIESKKSVSLEETTTTTTAGDDLSSPSENYAEENKPDTVEKGKVLKASDITPELSNELEAEKTFAPWRELLFLGLTWVGLLLFNFIIGYQSTAGIVCNTTIYWGLMFLIVPYLTSVVVGADFYLNRKYQRRQKVNYPYVLGDIKWTKSKTAIFSGASLCTGILAASFGLGGGTLNTPVMLELGVLPAVIPSTSGLMILLTSTVAILQYFLIASTPWEHMLWFGITGFFGGISGHLFIRAYVKKYKKQALLVFLLGFLIILGMICLMYTLSSSFINKTATLSFVAPC